MIVAVSPWLRVLLVLRLLGLLVFLLLLASGRDLYILEFAIRGHAGVVLGAAEILAVLVEDDGGKDKRSDKK